MYLLDSAPCCGCVHLRCPAAPGRHEGMRWLGTSGGPGRGGTSLYIRSQRRPDHCRHRGDDNNSVPLSGCHRHPPGPDWEPVPRLEPVNSPASGDPETSARQPEYLDWGGWRSHFYDNMIRIITFVLLEYLKHCTVPFSQCRYHI